MPDLSTCAHCGNRHTSERYLVRCGIIHTRKYLIALDMQIMSLPEVRNVSRTLRVIQASGWPLVFDGPFSHERDATVAPWSYSSADGFLSVERALYVPGWYYMLIAHARSVLNQPDFERLAVMCRDQPEATAAARFICLNWDSEALAGDAATGVAQRHARAHRRAVWLDLLKGL